MILFYVIAVLGSDQQFLLAIKNGLAKSVHLDEKLIKFDEVGVQAFAARMPDILRQAGFKGIMLEILASFCSGPEVVYQNLLQTPHQLTGEEYEVKAHVHLGFQAVQIFGTANITASIKQIVSYVPFYVDKALADASLIGLPITLASFNDALMETAHKLNKSQSLLFFWWENWANIEKRLPEAGYQTAIPK